MTPMEPLLTCQQLADFLGDYFEGQLPADQRREFERHLAVCPPCIHYLESYKTTVALAKLAHDCAEAGAHAPPPPDVPEDLIRAILASR